MAAPLPIPKDLLKFLLKFKLNDDGKLFAALELRESKPPLDLALIEEALALYGFSELFIYENALINLLKQYNASSENFVLEIGERRNGEFTISIDIVKMSARLTLSPPCGGVPVTLNQIRLDLQEKHIVSGIMMNEIQAALKEGIATERIIAKGLEPVPGIDARFQSLIPQIRERKPQINKHGVADYRDLGQLIVVKPGDPLMCRTPPTDGKNGWDITGLVILSQRGKDTQFSSPLEGAEIDPDTEFDADNITLLLAAISGQPKLVPQGVIVEPTINLPRVDLSTGNMNFEGTLNIKGDVKEGMKIQVAGDVFVGGTVEAAEIIAGGNIVIMGGVIGHRKQNNDRNKAPSFSAKIISKGSISAHFAENVCMDAGIDIIIEEFSMHNHLTALNQIVVGKSSGKKGKIIGGIACASTLVKTGILGSSSGVITKVRVGLNPVLQARMDKLTLEIDSNEKKQEDIKKIIAFILANPEKEKKGLLDTLLQAREKLVAYRPQLHAERMNLQSQIIRPEDAQVIVEESVHCGIEIQIGQAILKNNQNHGKGVFQLIDGKIIFSNVMFGVGVAR